MADVFDDRRGAIGAEDHSGDEEEEIPNKTSPCRRVWTSGGRLGSTGAVQSIHYCPCVAKPKALLAMKSFNPGSMSISSWTNLLSSWNY